MDDEERLRHALFVHIEQKTDELWRSIDDLQKALEAVPAAERSGPGWGKNGELSKRFIELMKRLGELSHQFRLRLEAIDESRVSTKH
jgi:hypothetical protein